MHRDPTRDEYEDLKAKYVAVTRDANMATKLAADLDQENRQLLRSLKHERKLREDMHNGVQAAKESLAQIRQLHIPWDETGPLTTIVFCRGCGHEWPCETLQAIREPEQLVITSLQVMKLELEASVEGRSSTKES